MLSTRSSLHWRQPPHTRTASNPQAGLSFLQPRRPRFSSLAAEVEVWRDALHHLRGMTRQAVIASVTSGLICGLMIFVFCCVFSEMIKIIQHI